MKVNGQPEAVLQHFSHPHPLTLSNHQPQQSLKLQQQAASISCACCKQSIASGWIYSCTPYCNYFLHVSCSKLPQQITHPFDQQKHALSLLSTPIYPDGVFNCDACMKHGNGFSYHCGACKIDLHPKCASLPLTLTHQSHPHQLSLTFSLAPGKKNFVCNICNQVGYKEWLYSCNMYPCNFTVHLQCATPKPIAKVPRAPPIHQQTHQGAAQAQAPHHVVGTPCFPTIPIQQTQAAQARPQFQNHVPNNMNYNNNNNGMQMPSGVYGRGRPPVRPVNNFYNGQLGQSAFLRQAANALVGFPILGFGGSSSQQQPGGGRGRGGGNINYNGMGGGGGGNFNNGMGGGGGGNFNYGMGGGGGGNFNNGMGGGGGGNVNYNGMGGGGGGGNFNNGMGGGGGGNFNNGMSGGGDGGNINNGMGGGDNVGISIDYGSSSASYGCDPSSSGGYSSATIDYGSCSATTTTDDPSSFEYSSTTYTTDDYSGCGTGDYYACQFDDTTYYDGTTCFDDTTCFNDTTCYFE